MNALMALLKQQIRKTLFKRLVVDVLTTYIHSSLPDNPVGKYVPIVKYFSYTYIVCIFASN
jgi:hypothetical protein